MGSLHHFTRWGRSAHRFIAHEATKRFGDEVPKGDGRDMQLDGVEARR